VDQVADSPKIKFAPMYILSETVLGNEHPSTLMSMNNLALLLRDQGKYEQAEEMH
jgi:Tetratricopeptide repeat